MRPRPVRGPGPAVALKTYTSFLGPPQRVTLLVVPPEVSYAPLRAVPTPPGIRLPLTPPTARPARAGAPAGPGARRVLRRPAPALSQVLLDALLRQPGAHEAVEHRRDLGALRSSGHHALADRRHRASLTQLVSLNSLAAGSRGRQTRSPVRGEARPRRRTASSERLCRHCLQHPPTRLRAPGPAPHSTPFPRRSGQSRAQIDKIAAWPTPRSMPGRQEVSDPALLGDRCHRVSPGVP
jgi:hypothetical protein